MGNANTHQDGQTFGYYIDLDERGDFQADVRNAQGQTVFEVRAGNSLGEDESSLIEDGYMRDTHDLDGLTSYLIDLQVIPAGAQVMTMSDFEALLEEEEDYEPMDGPGM
ncbi:hypothetical protein [Geopseudomonas aromaticivorans]